MSTCIFPSFSGLTASASTSEITTHEIAGAIGTHASSTRAEEAGMMHATANTIEKEGTGLTRGGNL